MGGKLSFKVQSTKLLGSCAMVEYVGEPPVAAFCFYVECVWCQTTIERRVIVFWAKEVACRAAHSVWMITSLCPDNMRCT